MSSARPFIMLKYSAMEELPFCAVSNAIHTLITRARDWEENIPTIASHTAAEVESDATYVRMS